MLLLKQYQEVESDIQFTEQCINDIKDKGFLHCTYMRDQRNMNFIILRFQPCHIFHDNKNIAIITELAAV